MKTNMTVIEYLKSHLSDSLNMNSYIVLGMRFIGPGGSFIFWALAARLLPPKDIGMASAAIASATLLAGIAQLGIGYGFMRYLPRSNNPRYLINIGIEVVSGSALILGIIFISKLEIWSPALISLRTNLWTILSFLVLVLSFSIFQLLNWIFLSKRKPIFSLIQGSIQTIISIVFLCLFFHGGYAYQFLISAYILSLVLSCSVSIFYFLPVNETGYKLKLTIPAGFRSRFMGYSLVNSMADQFQRSPDTLMTLLIVNLLQPERGAYFFLAWAVATGLQSLAASVAPSLLAEGSNQPEKAIKFAFKALKLGGAFALTLASIVLILSKFILSIYGKAYLDNGLSLFILLVISIIPGIVVPIFLNVLRIQGKLIWLLVTSGISLVLGLLLTYLFAVRFGLVGAGIGWLSSRFLMVALIAMIWEFQKSHFIPSSALARTS